MGVWRVGSEGVLLPDEMCSSSTLGASEALARRSTALCPTVFLKMLLEDLIPGSLFLTMDSVMA